MDLITFGLVNVPFTIVNILVNIFFISCMACPLDGRQIKQPLKLLLGTLICCTIIYLMSFLMHFLFFITRYSKYMLVSYLSFVYTLYTSMSSSVWLNFFFFTQIVPAKRASFIWIKKNIKAIIYCIWFFDKLFRLFDVGTVLIDFYASRDLILGTISYNFTMYDKTIYFQKLSSLGKSADIAFGFVKANLIICLCVMVTSSSSTVFYLCKHMRRMVATGQPFTCSRFRSQVRVTITGILQGLLYMLVAVWSMKRYFSENVLVSGYTFIHITVINLYMVGTTFNLGAGQSVFRHRAADIWLRAAQLLKGPSEQV
ncbi:taste receptor, type 2, member 201, tandem duplicate 1 [Antennarius striatus]|uniref:taste receptor, type 2, member 201, tandem duplicate 1 n=1 Tax=Antennarius striatus TaxID=241820 RepID=UPI0035B488CA